MNVGERHASRREVVAAAIYDEMEVAESQEWPDASPIDRRWCLRLADTALNALGESA